MDVNPSEASDGKQAIDKPGVQAWLDYSLSALDLIAR